MASDDILFGFLEDSDDAPNQPRTEAPRPLLGPVAPALTDGRSIARVIGENMDLTNEQVLDNVKKLSDKQKNSICLYARQLFVSDRAINATEIYSMWAVRKSFFDDPETDDQIEAAGPRPSINKIKSFMETNLFILQMAELGVEISDGDFGLTSEQLGVLAILGNITDKRTLRQKINAAGVPWAKFQSWQSQKSFMDAYRQFSGAAIKNAIPTAELHIAARMAEGDPQMIKFGFEVSGHYNPADRKQLDAQEMVRIILEVIEDTVEDPELQKKIGSRIQLRGMKALGGGHD